ncbi:MAG: hypothetical protein Q9185_000917 [Variospora sp. 1 TL-2023]
MQGSEVLPMKIALTQSNLDHAEEFLMDVSHPDSPNFGKHWTHEQIANKFAPSSESVNIVKEWLASSGIAPERISRSQSLGWLKFDATVAEAESLLKTEYHLYKHSTGKPHVACSSYHIPNHIRSHVDFITPTVHFDAKVPQAVAQPVEKRAPTTTAAAGHPVKTKAALGIGAPSSGSLPKEGARINIQGLIDELENCNRFITPNCLRALYLFPPGLTANPENSYGIVEYSPQAYLQGDLDLFFANFSKNQVQRTPTLASINGGFPQTTNQGFQFNGESDLDLEYAMTLINPQKTTLYQVGDQLQGGSFNDFLDALDGSYCAGDDPVQDSTYPNPYGTEAEGAYLGPKNCGGFAATKVISTSYGYNEADLTAAYEQRQCMEYMKLGLAGTSFLFSSGDNGVGGNGAVCIDAATKEYNDGSSGIFNPGFPSGCPYITSVGATQIVPGASVTQPEKACETVIFSGGGFSNVFGLPSYQSAAVQSWFTNNAPPYGADRFNNSQQTRGFPDISANGANYVVAVTGQFALVYGTSASSPVFGAILTLINEARFAAGKGSVGFVNPTLYANPDALNDITQGTNPGCGTSGFAAVSGWDPASGANFQMAFLGGAECSTAGNPLSQFTKHVQDDKSLQRDRFVGAGPSGLQESFRTPRNGASQEAAMQDFLQEGRQLPPDFSQPFVMEQMRRDLDGYRISSSSVASPAWAQEFDPSERARMEAAFRAPKVGTFLPAAFSPAEYQRFRQSERSQSPRLSSPSMQTNGYIPTRGWGYGANRMAAMGPYDRGSAVQRRQGEPLVQSKAKGRMVELDDQDWEQQFAEFDQTGKLQEQDLDTDVNAAMEAELNDMDRSVPLTESNEYGDFESVWRGIQAENAEYASQMLNDDSLSNFDFDKFLRDDPGAWDSFDGNFRDPHLGDYLFEDSNIFSSAKDPYDEGTRIMREAGNLSLAALAFEAAVQRDPQHLLAWVALGNAQAQNEKETPAIRALEQAIHIDPNHLPALMGLAISYTNEGYDSTAYRTLERWLSIKYPSVLPPDEISAPQEMGFTDRHLLHEKVTDCFIRAAQLSPQGEHMDPDVQVGLGVLFYGAEEYAKAVDCFEAALASSEQGHSNHRDQAHLLWNRLGATLANSGRSEEAIQAYEKALQLNPNFVRARYNLGVSCINIGCNEEAAQHLLGALAMHGVVEREGVQRVREVMGEDISNGDIGRGLSEGDVRRMASMNQSTNLIETLRRVFGNMGRKDLAERVQIGMDVESFRGEFDF